MTDTETKHLSAPARLRSALFERGWTQVDLAKRTGFSTSYISDILKGRRRLGVASSRVLARALNLDPKQLLVAQLDEDLAG